MDLYSILAKAVDALDPNTIEARRRLYERARAALVAETGGADQSDFLNVLGSLEEAVQRLEAEAQANEQANEQRERHIPPASSATATAPSRHDIVRASRRPEVPIARQRFGRFMAFFARTFRPGAEGVRDLPQRTVDASETLANDLSNEADCDQARDNWLSDVLARASRAEPENGDRVALPRRDVRRNR